jgi:glycogen(starch) synthase
MRVLLVSDFYPPHPGGLEAHVARLATHLTARGHQVNVATVAASSRQDGAVRVHGFDLSLSRLSGVYAKGRAFHPPWPDRRFAAALRDLARRVRPGVIHAHGWSAFSAVAVGRRLGIPVVTTLHDYGLLCPTKSLNCDGHPCRRTLGLCCVHCSGCEQGLVKRVGLAAAIRAGRTSLVQGTARFLAVSRFVADTHLDAGIGTAETMTVVPNFVDLVDHAPAEVPADGPVLFVGSPDVHKGRAVLERAHAQLVATGGASELHLVGGPPREPAGAVHHLGRRSGTALWSTFRQARAVSVPSVWHDPCPTVALEAMALGRPVVASAVGGLTDIVNDGETGLLVPPRDAGALADALRDVLADPVRARRMGDAARRRAAAQFSAHAVIPRIEAIYQEVSA